MEEQIDQMAEIGTDLEQGPKSESEGKNQFKLFGIYDVSEN